MALSLEDQIINQLLKSQHILLLASAPADGDSLGSATALYMVLTQLGKKATVICPEPVPKDLKFLPMMEKVDGKFRSEKDFIITVNADVKAVRHEIMPGKVNIVLTPAEGVALQEQLVQYNQADQDYDLIVTVDTGDLVQLGKIYEEHVDLFYRVPVINIDHHASNGEFGVINYVDITASATTQMLLPMIRTLEQRTGKSLMNEDIATLLLAGLVTDTGSFQHSNTTPQAFAVAAELLSLGARQQEIIKHVYKTKSLAMLKLWGQVLSKIQFAKDHRFVWSTVTQKDLEETGAEMEDSGAIIDELLNNAPGAEVVALLKEKQPGLMSGSLRTTTNEVEADVLAGLFGGGGHKRAAGFRVKNLPFEAAVKQVITTILEKQAERHHLPPLQGGIEWGIQAPSPLQGISNSSVNMGGPLHLNPNTAENPSEATIVIHDLGDAR